MKTIEILISFLNGNEVTIISDKQKAWLLRQAKIEGLKTNNDGFHDFIYLDDCHYKIKQCKTRVGGYGGTIGTKIIQGKYRLEKLYTIKFDSTGITGVHTNTDLMHFRTTEHTFQIINQL